MLYSVIIYDFNSCDQIYLGTSATHLTHLFLQLTTENFNVTGVVGSDAIGGDSQTTNFN